MNVMLKLNSKILIIKLSQLEMKNNKRIIKS